MSGKKLATPAMLLNIGSIILSLALVGMSIAIFVLNQQGARYMKSNFPAGQYAWYIGSRVVGDHRPRYYITLAYTDTSENVILMAAAFCLVAGLVTAVGSGLACRSSRPMTRKSVLSLFLLPGLIAFITTLSSLAYSQIIVNTENHGLCENEHAYTPDASLLCTPEQAACSIAPWLAPPEIVPMNIPACVPAKAERHVVTALFTAATVLLVMATSKYIGGGQKQYAGVGSADERVERLQREEI